MQISIDRSSHFRHKLDSNLQSSAMFGQPSTQYVLVRHQGAPGLLAALLGCVFAVLGIFSLGIIFIPIAAACTLIAVIRGTFNFNLAAFGTTTLAIVLTVIGVLTSPALLIAIGGLFAFSTLNNQNIQSTAESHLVKVDAGHFKPEDGYVWIINPPVAGDLRVRWEPGRASLLHPHTISAAAEGHWLPDAGYVWNNDPPAPGDFGLHWAPGRTAALHPHVISAAIEGNWTLEDGYQWLGNPQAGDLRIGWEPWPPVFSAHSCGRRTGRGALAPGRRLFMDQRASSGRGLPGTLDFRQGIIKTPSRRRWPI